VTLLAGRYAAVLNDESAPQQIDVRKFEFPPHGQGVLDYVRDVLVDPSFRDELAAEVHAVRALVEFWLEWIHTTPIAIVRTEAEIHLHCRRVVDFVKQYPLGVTIVG
jgi:hypothetical protein